jgi:hypothetical protein
MLLLRQHREASKMGLATCICTIKTISQTTTHENNLKINNNTAGQFGSQPCTITVDFLTRTPFGCT